MKIDEHFSAYLDSLRLGAALVVFVSHAATGAERSALLPAGHSAVIVFFVLSGYVIAASAARTPRAIDYAIQRAARIYSVVVPALALGLLLDWALDLGKPGALGDTYQLAQPWKYLPLFLVFGNEAWFLHEDAFSNVPFWSLCYEVWYYVLFGIAVFARGGRRVGLYLLVMLAVGPRLWLLLPVWLLGALLWRAHERAARLPAAWARLLFAASLAAIAALKLAGSEAVLNEWFDRLLGGWPTAQLRYSRFVLGDYGFALLVAVNLFAARYCRLTVFRRWRRPLGAAASVTFSLYLTHFPLLVFLTAWLPERPVPAAALALAAAAGFGIVFERRKDRLRDWLRRIVSPAGEKTAATALR